MVSFFKEVEREVGFMDCPSGKEVELFPLLLSINRIDCSWLIGKVRLVASAGIEVISHPRDVFCDRMIAVPTFNPILFVMVFWDIPELIVDTLIARKNFRKH